MTQVNDVTKQYLQSLPIWQYFDEMKAQLGQLKHDWEQYSSNLDQISTRFSKLPEIGTTQQICANTADNDCDIVRVYKKKEDGEYSRYDGPPEQSNNSASTTFRNKSIAMLEEKVKADEEMYAMINPDQPWIKCKIICVFRRPHGNNLNKPVITFKIRAPPEFQSRVYDVDKYAVARIQDHGELLKPPKRVIAGVRKSSMFAGIIGQEPFEDNLNRYLVHMDDGSARYFRPNQIYPILGQSSKPWRDSRYLGYANTDNEACLRVFFNTYPQRRLMRVKVGDEVDIYRDIGLVRAKVLDIDCDIARVLYKDAKEEYVYRGSPRWLADKHLRAKQLRNVGLETCHEGLAVHIHHYEQAGIKAIDEDLYKFCEDFDHKVIVSRNHNRAKKSTATSNTTAKRFKINLSGQQIEEDRDTVLEADGGDNHKCNPDCLIVPGVKTEIMIDDIKAEFRNESDLKVPLLLGWKRGFYKFALSRNTKPKVGVRYESPCGKIFSRIHDIRLHLKNTRSKMDIDYFSLERDIKLNSDNGSFDAFYYVENIAVDSRTGEPLENKNISLMNPYSEERLPADFEYRNESFPHPMLKAKGFSFNYDFKSSCDCKDDCFAKVSCACHRLNEEQYGKNTHHRGTLSKECQYNHKRLENQVATGIFECNSKCECSSKCSNRVVQNGIRFRLQVRKTLSKGWGVITLDDIPKGAFICTYAAELLDDADQYGDSDMYYADLDYISVNEETKEKISDSDEGVDSASDGEIPAQNGKRKSVPRIVESEDSDVAKDMNKKEVNDSSSISSFDGEAFGDKYLPEKIDSEKKSRYPKRRVQGNQAPAVNIVPTNKPTRVKFRKIHDLLETHDYTLDARMQGNVGRFFNHSCDPNAYVQNVFLETHDLRFPIVAFFAQRTIKALGEITWNYNYKMGSIQGRRIDCYCGSSNCRGRIL